MQAVFMQAVFMQAAFMQAASIGAVLIGAALSAWHRCWHWCRCHRRSSCSPALLQ